MAEDVKYTLSSTQCRIFFRQIRVKRDSLLSYIVFYVKARQKWITTKGQLISKGLVGTLNSSKKPNENKLAYIAMIPQVELFSFFFWKN